MKRMHNISIDTDDSGNVVLRQEVNDLNEPDPEILISAEQAPLVASWLYEAGIEASDARDEETQQIPVRFYARGPEAEAESLQVFTNTEGMIILRIDEDAFIEVSPTMAKRLRDQLSRSIREALTDMLRPDAEA